MYTQGMNWLNYHHLRYFWTVAKEGTIAAACRHLHLSQPTISAQLRSLEQALGHKLFEKSGRNLVMTETGRAVFRYADEIFSIGLEMLDSLKGRTAGSTLRLVVGVADVMPKLIAYRMLRPVLSMPDHVRLICMEGKPTDLLARLAVHELDVVLTDTPLSPQYGVRAFSHRLGESTVSVFGIPKLCRQFRRGFPLSLGSAPLLLPSQNTMIRRLLEQWFESKQVRPTVVAEFEDSALMKVFGQSGAGLFFAPTAIADDIQLQYSVKTLGEILGPIEQFYAISMERRVRHPGVQVIASSARKTLVQSARSRAYRRSPA